MAEPLKTFFSPELVRRLAGDIERVYPAFPSRAFIRDATKGLETHELLDRGKHHTTRTPRPGRHVIDVIVNGEASRVAQFTVTA